MTRAAVAGTLLVIASLAGAGCRSGDAGPALVLDGRPRHPDDEGVVTAVSRRSITLDGSRRYRLSERLQAFSTSTLEAVPVLARHRHYVQVGIEDTEVQWLAAFSVVVRAPGAPATVYYVGTVARLETGRKLVFADGSVLALATGVAVPPAGTTARAEIDPEHHWVRALTAV